MHVFPLLELCAAGVLLLSTLGITNTNYADYRREGEPPIAAVFAAAQDGVYPWSVLPDAPDAPESEAPALPETPDAPQAPEQPDEPAPGTPDDSGESTPEAPEAPTLPFFTVDASYFDDALFLGDSHTDGFYCYAGLRNATYYTRNGMILREVFTKSYAQLDGKKVTLEEALAQQHFGKIYIMLGINQVSYDTVENFAQKYSEMIDRLRLLQPDATIYIQSILHTTQHTSDTTNFNNAAIDAFNTAIAELADGESIFYLDINPVFDDETGALRADWSGDGVHVRAAYYTLWRDLLYEYGVARG